MSSPTAGNGPTKTYREGYANGRHDGRGDLLIELDCQVEKISAGQVASGPLSPEALYELKLDTVRRFINHLHHEECWIADGSSQGPNLTDLMIGFMNGETK